MIIELVYPVILNLWCKMLIVIDDFLSGVDRDNINKTFLNDGNMKWTNSKYNFIQDHCVFTILTEANKYYNLQNMVGYESWSNYGNPISWHYDKDEYLWNTENVLKTPICSIVYYGIINNVKGGRFLTESEIITPKNNRLLIFSPCIFHSAEDYSGERLSIAINPWDYKPKNY